VVRCRGHWRLRRCCVVVGGGGSRGRREFKNPKIIPYTEPMMMTERITPNAKVRVWYSRSTFNHVHALDIISPPLQHRR
jgi:hypothetical protein